MAPSSIGRYTIIRPLGAGGMADVYLARATGERDGLQWYCEKCNHKLHEYRFILHNIEKDFLPRFREFYASTDLRTCKQCGHVMEADPRFV